MTASRSLVWCVALYTFASHQASARAQAVPVAAVHWLGGDNQPIDPQSTTAPFSRRITNDDSLSRNAGFDQTSDIDDLRVEISGVARETVVDSIVITSTSDTGVERDRQAVSWTRGRGDVVRTAFVRLTGDAIDRAAEGSNDQTLRVALGDRVRVTATTGTSILTGEISVGRPAGDSGPTAARFAKLRAVILRSARGSAAVIGHDDASAIDLVRKQINDASEVWLQCYVSLGDPARADVVVVDPPTGTLLAIGDEDGLAAYGGGAIRFRANDVLIDAGSTRPGAAPVETALLIATALGRAGFLPRVTENPPTELGAGRSADVLARDAQGLLVTYSREGAPPLSSDTRQSVLIGSVNLADGLAEFNNMTASAGSLEERALIKSLSDDDPTTIDLFIVNRFTFGTRQGEAFIENGGGPISNVVVLDRIGLRQLHTAFTLPHEVGHILLNQPYHPDNVGPDAPWRLMDSDSNLGSVIGPKRLTWDECLRARSQSADSLPALLTAPVTPAATITNAVPAPASRRANRAR